MKFIKRISIAVILAIILSTFSNTFFIRYFTVPSSSMEGTLLPGEDILVSKLHYGARVSFNIFSDESFSAEYKRMPALSCVSRNDVVVFNSPANFSTVLVKRCIGLPGDIIRITHTQVSINKGLIKLPSVQFDYKLISKDFLQTSKLLDSLMIVKKNQVYNSKKNYFLLTIPETKAEILAKSLFTDTVYRIEKTGGNNYNLFPNNKRENWSRDNYGPLQIPFKGMIIRLTASNISTYKKIIAFEGNKTQIKGHDIYFNSVKQEFYHFKKNYYFMMGDNRHHSIDSRWIGFIPEDMIIGKAIFIMWSKDLDADTLRTGRLLLAVE